MLTQFQGGDLPFQLMQNSWAAELNPIIKKVNGISDGSGVIQEFVWNSNITTLLNAGDSDTTSFGSGAAGVRFGSFNSATIGQVTIRRVRFQNPITNQDLICLEYSQDGGTTWVDQSYITSQRQGSYIYGWYIYVTTGKTDLDIAFGNAGAQPSSATYANPGQAWSTFSGDVLSWWRVRKITF